MVNSNVGEDYCSPRMEWLCRV